MPDPVTLLASVMVGEAGVLGPEAMLFVGHVVMNRVSSPCFPDTVVEVIEQQGQFNGRGIPKGCHLAMARRVLRRSRDPTGGMLYVLSEQDRERLGFPEGDLSIGKGGFQLHFYRRWRDEAG